MKHIKTSILIIGIFFSSVSNILAQDFGWAKKLGGATTDVVFALAVDAGGNVISTGRFTGTSDFDPGSSTFNLTSAGQDDIFICKLDPMGNFIWAKRLGGIGTDNGNDVVVDNSGNIYIIGAFQGTVDFDPGVNTFNLTSAGSFDIFICKFDATGNFVWVKNFGGSLNDHGNSLDLDVNGNVYATGAFSGTADFDPGTPVFNLISVGGFDIFVSKLDASGNLLWAKRMGGPSNDRSNSMAVDASGNVLTTGYFSGTVDFDPGTSVFNLISTSPNDIFVSKLDTLGSYMWAKKIGGAILQSGKSLALDASGNVLLTGDFFGTADFDPGLATFNLTSLGTTDIFICKLDANGNFNWAVRFGGNSLTATNGGQAIAVDAAGNSYTTGYFRDITDFDPDTTIFNLSSAGLEDVFIVKLDTSGNFVWAVNMGGNSYDYGYSIEVDVYNNVYTAGYFYNTADFDPGIAIFNLTSAGMNDIFISVINQCDEIIDSISPVACDNYLSPSGNYVWINSGIYHDTVFNPIGCDSVFIVNLTIKEKTQSNYSFVSCNNYLSPSGKYIWTKTGIYLDTIPNFIGCDSIITVNLIIDTVDVSISSDSRTLTANTVGSSYQWLDCDNNFAIISGETNNTFTPQTNGNYSVQIMQNGCVDTSSCEVIETVNVLKYGTINDLQLFPNPTTGPITINPGFNKKDVLMVLRNENWQLISRTYITSADLYYTTIEGPSGIYFVELFTPLKRTLFKVIKS